MTLYQVVWIAHEECGSIGKHRVFDSFNEAKDFCNRVQGRMYQLFVSVKQKSLIALWS